MVGCSLEIFKKWFLQQLYGERTEENYGSVCTNGYCYSLSKTQISNQSEMNKPTYWKNLRPMYCSDNTSEGSKIDHQLNLTQEMKAKYF